MSTVQPLDPIFTAHLFPKVEALLLDLLRSLSDEDWERQTVAPKWKVRDVAAHLLDTALRKLSICRDGFVAEAPDLARGEDIVSFVNRLNAEGVAIYRRLSPPVLISLMDVASRQSAEFHQAQDPFAQAMFGVSWAGERTSPNWFDTARELTERWHHQQQIRLAVGRPGLMSRELYAPVLDCFMRGLPHRYRSVSAPAGTHATFRIAGDCGGEWYLYRDDQSWRLTASPIGEALSTTVIPQEIAWRVFTKGISPTESRARTQITGDTAVGAHVLGMVAIVG
jgi:uncharacterized protein (TIGR03083 family)